MGIHKYYTEYKKAIPFPVFQCDVSYCSEIVHPAVTAAPVT